ncbi:Macro domain [Fragilaria crotonensis]|nr:Macro domain [Fragilaria crotonensis]
MLDSVVPHINSDGFIPEHLIPTCKYCGGDVFGNVRGDSSFLHGKYEAQNDALRHWMKAHRDSNSTVVIIEVGAGYNTPTVTRFPVESFARQLGSRGHLIRINPTDPEVPSDLTNALAIAEGWQVLNDIELSSPSDAEEDDKEEVMNHQTIEGMTLDNEQSFRFAPRFGHFDWNTLLGQLKDD